MYLQSIMEFIREQYNGDFSESDLLKGAARGMLDTLDDYTYFMTPEEAKTFMEDISGEFYGIGIVMESHKEGIRVIEVYSPSPAESAGIKQGDLLLEADGHNLSGKTTDEAAGIIRGKKGTSVKLKVLPYGEKEARYVDVVRDTVIINPVRYEVRGGVGYIKLEKFNEYANEFVTKALDEFDKKGIEKIILDLRGNPGGDVDQAVAIARRFVPEGVITTLDYKSDLYQDVTYVSNLKNPKYKLAVLVNDQSASASELLSAAIQDTGAGKLVGTRTFGKAKVQMLFPLLTPEAFTRYYKVLGERVLIASDLYYYNIMVSASDIIGYAKMTVGLYYSPKGRLIDGVGLRADIIVLNPKPVQGVDITDIGMLTGTSELGLNGWGADVLNAKKILKALGYETGPLDNVLDAATQNGIKAYQKDKGLKVTGILDGNTRKALNSSRLELIEKYDRQYIAAYKYLN